MAMLTTPYPAFALLNIGITRFQPQYHTTLPHVFLSAKYLITRMRCKDLAPNISELIALINLHYTYEHSLAIRANLFPRFEQAWKLWVYWLSTWSWLIYIHECCHVSIIVCYSLCFLFLFLDYYVRHHWGSANIVKYYKVYSTQSPYICNVL